jgi:hypothetical protein
MISDITKASATSAHFASSTRYSICDARHQQAPAFSLVFFWQSFAHNLKHKHHGNWTFIARLCRVPPPARRSYLPRRMTADGQIRR